MAAKITLTGMPTGDIVATAHYFRFEMEEGGSPAPPKGLPVASVMTFTVFVAVKSGKKLGLPRKPAHRLLVQGELAADLPISECPGEMGVIAFKDGASPSSGGCAVVYLGKWSLERAKDGIDMEEMRAIETTGRVIDAQHIETVGSVPVGQRVRLVIIWPDHEDDGFGEAEWMAAAARNSLFDFLVDPAEDVYTLTDGEPIELEK